MLHQIKTEEFPKLEPMIQRHIDRCGCSDRTSVRYGVAQATLGMSQGVAGVWTDDIENPTCYLVCSVVRMSILDEVAGIINCIYLDNPEDPDAGAKISKMIKTAETFFIAKSCDVSYGSSWVYNGDKDVQALWDRAGYLPQEILNVKKLK